MAPEINPLLRNFGEHNKETDVYAFGLVGGFRVWKVKSGCNFTVLVVVSGAALVVTLACLADAVFLIHREAFIPNDDRCKQHPTWLALPCSRDATGRASMQVRCCTEQRN